MLSHKDADGLGTYLWVHSGVKMWTIIHPDGVAGAQDQHKLEQVMMPLVCWVAEDGTYKKQWLDMDAQVTLVQAEPGDLL